MQRLKESFRKLLTQHFAIAQSFCFSFSMHQPLVLQVIGGRIVTFRKNFIVAKSAFQFA
jgi:hypothetical protein